MIKCTVQWHSIHVFALLCDHHCDHSPELFLKDFICFIFRQRGREGERESDKHQCMVASNVSPTGDLARNPGMCPDWKSNQ